MRFSIIAIAATLLSTVLAQQAYPTAPIGSTKWNAGATVNIKWKLNPPAATAGLKVELLSGDNPQTQKVVANLGTGAPGATSLSVALPANLKSDFYTIRIGDSYSAYFLIQGSGPVPSGPAPTAGTATVGPVPTANTSTTITSTTGGAPIIPTTSTTTGAPKPTGNSAGFLKAGNVVPMAAAAAAVVLAMAF
ncbi:hypothetical protein BGX29_006873 [Mortierella sp. GBA35]|nr:hypothetical protein BGX29_006873 [Mortierella sp. GBA35]